MHSSHARHDETAPLLPDNKTAASEASLSPITLVWVLCALFILLFFAAVQMSMMTTIQGVVVRDFNAYAFAPWLTSSYMIPVGTTTALTGRLVTIFSVRRILLAVSIGLTAGSLICGLAPSASIFIFGRVISGLSAGALIPSSAILMLDLASTKRRGLFIGAQNSAYTVGVALGGVLSGYATTHYNWHVAFWFQTPFLLAASITLLSMPRPEKALSKRHLLHIDYLGVLFLSASLCFFLYSLSTTHFVLWSFMTAILSLFAFLGIELRVAQEPVIPITLLKFPPLLYSCFATLTTMTARWTILFYTPVYTIAVLGWTPTQAGAALIPSSLGFVLGSILSGQFFIKHGGSYYWSSIASVAGFSATFLLLHIATSDTPLVAYAALIMCNGIASGGVLNFSYAHLLFFLDEETASQAIATSVISTFRAFAGSIGASVGGGIMVKTLESELWQHFAKHGTLKSHQIDLIKRLKASPYLVWQLEGYEHHVAIGAYRLAINRVIIFGGCLAIVALLCQAGARRKPQAVPDLVEEATRHSNDL